MPRIKKQKNIEEVMVEKAEQPAQESKRLLGARLVLVLLFLAIFGGAIFFGGYFYFQYKKVLKNQPISAKSEVEILTEKIGKFIDLPTDEEPTIAEVKDTEKLKGQSFFSSAQNGDKVLIYSKNKKAILYRPETGKVIEATSLGEKMEESPQVAAEEDAVPVVPEEELIEENIEKNPMPIADDVDIEPKKVVVYNGAKTKGLAQKLADKITAELTDIEIISTGNAIGDYEKTIVIDLSGNNSKVIEKIISTVGGENGVLPEEEKKPEGDILIIGGEK